jgi:RNA-directed DNA polymerase
MGGWAVAQSPILGTSITLSRLKKRGYESLSDYYAKVLPGSKGRNLFSFV